MYGKKENDSLDLLVWFKKNCGALNDLKIGAEGDFRC